MALLRSITINTTPGLTYVNYPPQYLGLSIVCVKREGLQYDRTTSSPSNREWRLTGGLSVRIQFETAFNSGEKVFVIYKPIE